LSIDAMFSSITCSSSSILFYYSAIWLVIESTCCFNWLFSCSYYSDLSSF